MRLILLNRSLFTDGLLYRISGPFILTGLALVLSMIAQALLARTLGVQDYGLYVYVFSWLVLLSIPSRLGLATGAVRLVAQLKAVQDWSGLKGFLYISSVFPILSSLIVGFIAFAVINSFDQANVIETSWPIWILGILIVLPLYSFTSIQSGKLRGFKQATQSKLPGTIELLIFILLIYIFSSTMGENYSALFAMIFKAVALVCTAVVGTLLLMRCKPPQLLEYRPRYDIKKWGNITIPLLLVSGLSIILKRTDILMLGFLSGTTDAGIYAAISRIADLSLLSVTAVNTVVNPMIAEYFVSSDIESLQKIVTLSARIVFLSTLIMTVFVVCFWPVILGLFGSEFFDGKNGLFILMSGQIILSALGPIGQVLIMTKHEKTSTLMLTGTAITNFAANALLIPIWGMTGAAVATTLSMVVWAVVFCFQTTKLIPIRPSIFG